MNIIVKECKMTRYVVHWYDYCKGKAMSAEYLCRDTAELKLGAHQVKAIRFLREMGELAEYDDDLFYVTRETHIIERL